MSIAGLNVKKFGRKIINARDRLEDGPNNVTDTTGMSLSERLVKEPLEESLGFVKTHEFHQDCDDPISLILDEIDDVEYPMLFPGKRIIVLRASNKANRFESGMLKRMSYVASLAIKNRGPRMTEAENVSIVDTVPILDTREQRPEIIDAFKKRVAKQLLPMEVQLSGIEFHTKY
jgi:hypothetical protein